MYNTTSSSYSTHNKTKGSTMSSSTTQTTDNRQKLNRLTNKILNTHSLHFIPISLLFLPFTIVASFAVQFNISSKYDDVNTMFDPINLFYVKAMITSSQDLLTFKSLITLLAFFCFIVLPTFAGVALITFSTNQIIHHKPITFSSTLKSLSRSYIPLLYTFIPGSITLVIVFLVFTLSPIAAFQALKALGFHFGPFSFTIYINLIASYALAFTISFFISIWGSAATITVLESKTGFESLRKSMNQSSEFRRHSFFIVFFVGFLISQALSYPVLYVKVGPVATWVYIFHIVSVHLLSSLLILQAVVANTVLYVQWNVASREEIAKTAVEGELSDEDVRLIVNDKEGDVLHELDEEKANINGGFNYMIYLLGTLWLIFSGMQFYYQSKKYSV